MNDKVLLCGLDEAGRGPLAGPVCAAAVILPETFNISILNDSKKLSHSKRVIAMSNIYSQALSWGIGWASPEEIDRINILNASLLAMQRAFAAMICSSELDPCRIRPLVDGLHAPELPVPCEALVKADCLVPEVMAASILAKTARDRLMGYYGIFYPGYGYEKHMGYPTKAHREAIKRFGPSPIQRMSFKIK